MKGQSKIAIALFIIIILFAVAAINSNTIKSIYNGIINSLQEDGVNKTLVVGRANDSISLDPANTTETDSIKVTVNIFETLVKYEREGRNIVPGLAESWKSSEDGLTWVFYLRRGVKFHDGSNFNAKSVVFNFERWMDVDNPYHDGQFSYWNYVFGGFPGFIQGVKASSEHAVEIKLTKPYAPFLSALAMPVFGIQSPEAIKKYEEEVYKHPVGTGPFCFESWEQNKSIVLIKNKNYWGNTPKVDKLEFRVISSSHDRLDMLKKGEIHIADNLGPDDVAVIEEERELQLYLRPSFNVGYLAVNKEKAPINNRLVRTALSYSINKEEMIKGIFADIAKPAKTFIPPTLWGYNDSIAEREYDPLKASELLKEAGYPNGFKATLWVMNNSRNYFPKPLETAEYIRESMKKANIDVTIKTFNWDEYLNKINNGEHQMALIGWTGDIIDPDNFLYTLLSSDNAKPGLAGNYAFYKNSKVDLLLKQARETNNIVFRKDIYRRLLSIVDYDMPSIPLVHTMPVVATRTSVSGYSPFITGVESLENVDINIEQ